jgi:tripartite motif-containing protein 2/3
LGALGKPGNDDAHFNMPAGIDCDNDGRLYVADYYNGRVQVFSAEGKLVKSITVEHPAEVVVHNSTVTVWL